MSDFHELDELLGACALDAVEPDERRVIEEYLATNPRAAAEVQEHREVATMLAYTGMDAPEGLWDRISEALDEPPPAPGPELAKVMPMAGSARRAGRFAAWTLAAAAAVVAVVAVAVIVTDRSPADPLIAAYEAIRDDRDSRSTQLVSDTSEVAVEAVVDERGHGFVLAGDLPALPVSQTYQLWGVIDDQVISLGVLGPTPDLEVFTARAPLAALAITIEPAGGVISDGNPDGAYVGAF